MPFIPKIKRPWASSSKPKVDSRNAKHDPFYDTPQWRATRKMVLEEEPLCRMCMKEGKITAAQMVDHIKPRSKGGADFERSNLQPLCNKCHAKKTAKGERRF